MSSPTLPPGFARLAWSNLAAQAAEQIGLAAAPLVAVLALDAGAGATGLLQAAQTLPFLLLSIPAGLLADRMSRRRLMAGAEAVRAAALLSNPDLSPSSGMLTLPLLALLGFLGAAGHRRLQRRRAVAGPGAGAARRAGGGERPARARP